jgi:hypothetical protein
MAMVKQRPASLQCDIDADVLKLEFDNRWEGPGDAFQTIFGSMAGLEDGDVDNAALVQVQRVDDLCEPVGEPEYVRVKRLRVSS